MHLQPEELETLRSAARDSNPINALALCAVYLPHLGIEEARALMDYLRTQPPVH